MFGKSIQKMFGVAAVSLIIVSSGVAMERAASIEYETVERPANLQPDFIAPSDANLRFLAIKTIDGSRVDAVISQPNSKTAASSTAVVSVHGSGGSYDTDPNGFLVRLLAGKGYAVLAINTRQSGTRVNTENFLDVRRDIEAAVYTARAWVTARSFCTATASVTFKSSFTPQTTGTRINFLNTNYRQRALRQLYSNSTGFEETLKQKAKA